MFLRYDDWKGVESTRRRKSYKAFELILERLLGERIRADGACAVEMWSALANVDWYAPDHDIVSYSFREAGDVVAWLREDGDYMDWYCSGDVVVVAPWIGDTPPSSAGARFSAKSGCRALADARHLGGQSCRC